VKGFREEYATVLVERRGDGYTSVRDLWLRTGIPIRDLEILAAADTFGSLGLSRRQALWEVKGLIGTDGAETLPLFKSAGLPAPRTDQGADLPLMPKGEEVVHDYRTMSFSLKAHPLSFLRARLDERGTVPAFRLGEYRNGDRVEVAGLVLVRQRPGTASGIVFATLEDETGIANIVIWRKTFDLNRRAILASRLLAVRGRLQIEGLVIHVVAESFTDMTPDLVALASGHSIGNANLAPTDEGNDLPNRGRYDGREAPRLRYEEEMGRQARAALPRGRNFK
jgi:error-prone DNA polymerase